MSHLLHQRPLFASDAFRLHDVRCLSDQAPWGTDEIVTRTELVLPRRGVFVLRTRGEGIVLEPNRAAWLHRGEPYTVRHPADGGDRCTVLSISGSKQDRLDALLQRSGLPSIRSLRELPVGPVAYRLHRRLLSLVTEPGSDPAAVEEVCEQLLRSIAARSSERPRRPTRRRSGTLATHRDLAERTRLVLAASLGERRSLAEIARAVGCSPFHLCRVFRRETGASPGGYRRRLRIRTAQERLLAGEQDLTGLALDLGFFDLPHFTRTFRRTTGLPPSAWRSRKRRPD